MVRSTLVMIALLAFAGCKTENPDFCSMNPGLQGCPGDAMSGGSCTAQTDCKEANFPACDTDKKMCVQCFGNTHALCSGMTPRCDADTCVACVDDRDCNDTGVCQLNGACADPNKIINVVATGGSTAGTCGSGTMPCTLSQALTLVTSSRDIIKLGPGTYTLDGLHPTSEVTIDARGATIARSTNNAVMTVDNNVSVTLIGGTIHGDSGRNGDGIKCSSATLTIQETSIENNDLAGLNLDTCIVNITRANIHDNSKKPGTHAPAITVQAGTLTLSRSMITSNTGGGISILNGDFTIVGNVFSKNGEERQDATNAGSTIGGVSISVSGANNRFDFNTITQNKTQQGVVPGVQCLNLDLHMANNIIYDNISQQTTPPGLMPQTGGNCLYFYSDIKDSAATNNNLQADPMLDASYHLPTNSPLKGKADPSTDLTGIAAKDIDGDARIKRSGMSADIGADQIRGP